MKTFHTCVLCQKKAYEIIFDALENNQVKWQKTSDDIKVRKLSTKSATVERKKKIDGKSSHNNNR